jgi:hypothetical protein
MQSVSSIHWWVSFNIVMKIRISKRQGIFCLAKYNLCYLRRAFTRELVFEECIQVSLCDGTFFSTLVAIHIHSHTLVLLFSLSWYSVLMLKCVQQETLPPSVGVAGQDFVGATLRQEPCGVATLSSFPSCDMVVVFLLLPDFSSQPRNWLV